jgi:transcriptional regulator with XRE-family HTH domain
MRDVGRRLVWARSHARLSQRDLAARTGIAQPTIARIESGVVSPRLDTLDRLLSATGSGLELAPRIGTGVDRTLIRAALRRSPEERVLAAGAAGRNLAAYLRAARRGSRG